MAKLENCPTCGNQTSENADQCPSCGEPLASGWAGLVEGERQAKQWAEVRLKLKILVLGVVIILAVVGWQFGPDWYDDYKTSNLKASDSAAFREMVGALEKEVAAVPASDFDENIRLYLQLLKLDSENKRYASKVAHYRQEKKEADAAIEAARKAREEKAQAAVKAAANAVEAELRSEPWVVDLVHQPDAGVEWLIGMHKKNDREYGYAATVCNVLKSHGMSLKGMNVRIVDYHAFVLTPETKGNHRAASLGQVDCETFERKYP